MTQTTTPLNVALDALSDIRRAILDADPNVLTDTLWMPSKICMGSTVVDFIDNTVDLIRAKNAPDPAPASGGVEAVAGCPDDIRALGWAVAVHNDYRLMGEPHTFWLFTKDGSAIKGEGRSDAEALDQVRSALSPAAPPVEAEPVAWRSNTKGGEFFDHPLGCFAAIQQPHHPGRFLACRDGVTIDSLSYPTLDAAKHAIVATLAKPASLPAGGSVREATPAMVVAAFKVLPPDAEMGVGEMERMLNAALSALNKDTGHG